MSDSIVYTCEKCGVETGEVFACMRIGWHPSHLTKESRDRCEGPWLIGTPHLRLRIFGGEGDTVRFQIAEQKWRGNFFTPDGMIFDAPNRIRIHSVGFPAWKDRIVPAYHGYLSVRGAMVTTRDLDVVCASVQEFPHIARAVQDYCAKAAEWEREQARVSTRKFAWRCLDCGFGYYESAQPFGTPPEPLCLSCFDKRKAEKTFQKRIAAEWEKKQTSALPVVHLSFEPNGKALCVASGAPYVSVNRSEVTCRKCLAFALRCDECGSIVFVGHFREYQHRFTGRHVEVCELCWNKREAAFAALNLKEEKLLRCDSCQDTLVLCPFCWRKT